MYRLHLRLQIPEDDILHSHLSDNIKSYTGLTWDEKYGKLTSFCKLLYESFQYSHCTLAKGRVIGWHLIWRNLEENGPEVIKEMFQRFRKNWETPRNDSRLPVSQIVFVTFILLYHFFSLFG
jgi:hypothetical protein